MPAKNSKKPPLSIVLPAYNEESRLPQSIAKLSKYLDLHYPDCEVIIVVEKSEDNTLKSANKSVEGKKRFRVIENPVHRGKGFAVKTGMLKASGEYVLFMDADLSTDLSAVEHFTTYLDKNSSVDVAIGSREHPKTIIRLRQNIIRKTMGKIYNLLVRALVLPDYKDTQCGFKIFRKGIVKPLFSAQLCDGFAFDTEILLLAKKSGYKVAELPVTWINSPASKVNILLSPVKMLAEIIRIRKKYSKTL